MIALENNTLKVEVKDDNLDLTFKFELSNQELKEFKDICTSFEENSITFQNSNYICDCHFTPFLDGFSVVATIKSAMGKPLEIVDVDEVDNIQEHKD